MKKNLISIIILALLIVNIVLTSIMMFSVLSTNKKTASLVTDIASAISLDLGGDAEEEEEEAIPMEQTAPYTISDLTIILKKSVAEDGTVDEKDHVAILSVTLSMNTEHKDYKTYGADFATREDLVKGQIIEAVSQYTVEEMKENTTAVTDDILNRIQKLFDSDFIFDVSFSSTLYQ